MKNLKEILMYTLAALLVLGFFVLLGLLIFEAVPEQNKGILNLVVGALIASFSAVVNYFFGSSKGSSDKNELLKNKKP